METNRGPRLPPCPDTRCPHGPMAHDATDDGRQILLTMVGHRFRSNPTPAIARPASQPVVQAA
jgi:hypothetical protein